ncbi:BgTH12-04358 [Blumeria graminis f. sp. triticale]|uniref:BgTH12-04358 n=1 Tax=Blumeria graminis f. sp. triticale TaxID=1689686 RepID=A0A9W4GAR7_BLUGR|nr:BgTH12-04358 [Blumeria graminis f. sp. triticale]
MTEILFSTTSATDRRNQEAILKSQNIACILDDDAVDAEYLPQNFLKPFCGFILDFTSVARRHVDSHVRGSTRSYNPYSGPKQLQ